MQLPEERPAFKLPEQQTTPVSQTASLAAYGSSQQMQMTGTASGLAHDSKRTATTTGSKLR